MLDDVRYAIRSIRRSRANAVLAVFVLSLGTAAATTMFSVVRAVLLRSLPYPHADRLFVIEEAHRSKALLAQRLPPARFLELQAAPDLFELVGAYDAFEQNLTGAGDPDRVQVARVSGELLGLTGAAARTGRLFTVEDERPSSAPVAMLAERLWRRSFGAQPLQARTVRLDGVEFAVVGVMPDQFALPRADVYLPLVLQVRQSRVARHLTVVARLPRGLDVGSARVRLDHLSEKMAAAHPATDAGWRTTLRTLDDTVVGAIRPALRLLFAASLVFALIGVASVGSLLLVRFAARRRDFAVRFALGATRARLARQVIIESLLMGGLGAALGLGLAVPVADVLAGLRFARFDEIGIDPTVSLFAMTVSLVSSVLAGILPISTVARRDLRVALAGSGRTVGGTSGRLGIATAVQVAVAVALVVAATGLSVSFFRLIRVDPGFTAADVLTARMVLPRTRYRSAQDLRAFESALTARIHALPGVTAAGVVSALPLDGRRVPFNFFIEGRIADTHAQLSSSELRAVSASYLDAMRIRLLAGRGFTAGDSIEAPGVVAINRAMAQRFWRGEDPIGRRVSLESSSGPWLTIVGIVDNVRHAGLAIEPAPEMYRPFAQEPWPSVTLVVRSAASVEGLPAVVRRTVLALDPELPVHDVRSMDEIVERSAAGPRLWTMILQAMALVALVVACSGVFGVTAHSVAQRAPEIALRIALGAEPHHVARMIGRQAMRPVAAGLVVGVLAAWSLAGGMSALLFGVAPREPRLFASAMLVVCGAAACAAYLPARRASRVEPNVALRQL